MEITLTAGDRLPIPGGCIVTIENDIILIKEKGTKFKKGDFIARTDSVGDTLISIYDEGNQTTCFSSIAMYTDWDRQLYFNDICDAGWAERFATEEEKQILIEKLHEVGKDWDVEKCKVVDWKWKPKFDEICFCAYLDVNEFICDDFIFASNSYQLNLFRTRELCKDFCAKANELLGNAKKF